MNKKVIYFGATVGGMIGGYLPSLFGADGFSGWAILGSTVGGVAGIIIFYKLTK